MEKPTRRERGPLGFAVAAVLNAGLLVLLNSHTVWRPWLGGVVTADWVNVLWMANLAGGAQVMGNLFLMVAHPHALQRFFNLMFACFGCAGAVVTLQVFPFDVARFGVWATPLLRVVIVLSVVGGGLAILVNFIQLLLGDHPRHKPLPS